MMALVGLVAGAFSGLFGIGGGVITVPALVLLVGLGFRQAVSVSLLTMLLTTPLALWRQWRAGHVLWRTGVTLGAAGILGVLLASLVDPHLSDDLLLWLFAAFLLYAAQRVAYGNQPLIRMDGRVHILATGFAGGVVAKLLGVGGGLVVVPSLVLAGHSMHRAVATSLVSIETNAAFATAVNLARVPGPWPIYVAPVAVGALLGVWLGTKWELAATGARLRRAFALLLSIVSFTLVHRAFG